MVTRTLISYSATIAHKDAISGKPMESEIVFATNSTSEKVIERALKKAVKAQLGTTQFFPLGEYTKKEVTYYIADVEFMANAKVWKIDGVVTDEYKRAHSDDVEEG